MLPLPTTRPWLWKWDEVLPLARRAGEIITLERGGDRRVLAFANPGLHGLPFTSTTTLWGAIQYLGPHESAHAHRHTPSAIRFVMTGSGAYTTVNGDACQMEAGDLVLTPIWNWHDHNNDGNEPMVWFDGLDLPLMTSLESIFFENHPQQLQPVEGHNLSERAFTGVGLREMGAPAPEAHSPLLRYRWDVTDGLSNSLHAARGGGSLRVWVHQSIDRRFPGGHLRLRDAPSPPGRPDAHGTEDREFRLRCLPRSGTICDKW